MTRVEIGTASIVIAFVTMLVANGFARRRVSCPLALA
jgi:hypothetical protein